MKTAEQVAQSITRLCDDPFCFDQIGCEEVIKQALLEAYKAGMTEAANLVQTTGIIFDKEYAVEDKYFHQICDTFEQAILTARDAKKEII